MLYKVLGRVSLPDLVDGLDAVAGEIDAEALELGGVVVLVLEDEVEVVVPVTLHGPDGSVVIEGAHQGCGVVHLLDEVGDIQADDVIDAAEGIFRIGLEPLPVDVDGLAVEDDLLGGDVAALDISEMRAVAQCHHVRPYLFWLYEIDSLLQPAQFGFLVDDLRLVVEVLAPDPVGEIVTHQLFDAVFQHVADDQRDEKRKGQRAELPLEGEAHHRGEKHRDPGGDAEIELFHDHPVPALRGAEVKVALDVFLQNAEPVDEYPVVQTVILPDLRIAHPLHVLSDPAIKRGRLAGQFIRLPVPQPLDEFKNMLAGDVADELVPAKVHSHHALRNRRSVDD